MAHLATILLAVVRLHVDHEYAPTWREYAPSFLQYGRGIADVMEDQHEQREIDRAIGHGHRFQGALPQPRSATVHDGSQAASIPSRWNVLP